MNYTLMHKDIPVVEIALDDGGTKITRVGELYHREDLPVGVPITWDKADRAALNAWCPLPAKIDRKKVKKTE